MEEMECLRKMVGWNTFRLLRCGSQVVRQRSAKPLFAGSIPARTSRPYGPKQLVTELRIWHGPTLRAFASLEDDTRDALRRDLERSCPDHDLTNDATPLSASTCLQGIAVVK